GPVRRGLGKAQEHENRCRLSCSIRPGKAKDFSLLNHQIERIHGELVVVALREIMGFDNSAHLRPRRKKTTASPMTTKPTMPKPTQFQIVALETVAQNSTNLFTSGELAVRLRR